MLFPRSLLLLSLTTLTMTQLEVVQEKSPKQAARIKPEPPAALSFPPKSGIFLILPVEAIDGDTIRPHTVNSAA